MALYDKKKVDELVKVGDAEEIIAYLREGGSARARKVSGRIHYKPGLFDYPEIRGKVLYWILLKIKDKKDRRIAADFYPLLKHYDAKESTISRWLAEGMLEEAQREDNYEPLNFFLFNDTGNIRLARWLLETNEYAFWKGLVDGLVRYPEDTKKKLKFFGPMKLDILPLLPMLEDKLSIRIYLQLAKKILSMTKIIGTPNLINLFDSIKSQTLRNTLIFKLIEQSSTDKEESTIRDLISKFGYDEDFDPYTEIVAENKARLRNILSEQNKLPAPRKSIPLPVPDFSSEEEEEDFDLDSNNNDYTEEEEEDFDLDSDNNDYSEESESLLSEESD